MVEYSHFDGRFKAMITDVTTRRRERRALHSSHFDPALSILPTLPGTLASEKISLSTNYPEH